MPAASSSRKIAAGRMAGMMRIRSVPLDMVLPHVMYQDLPAAIAWLGKAFGFVEH
jgi:hypothetical protein